MSIQKGRNGDPKGVTNRVLYQFHVHLGNVLRLDLRGWKYLSIALSSTLWALRSIC